MHDHIVLELDNVSKRFPNVEAIKNVSLRFVGGELHVLLGENAAGKSTLIKIISGLLTPDSGSVRYNGEPIQNIGVGDVMSLNIATLYQENTLFGELTALENVFMKDLPGHKYAKSVVNFNEMLRKYRQLMDSIGFDIDFSAQVKDLIPAQKRIVEIAKLLSSNPDVIILDEPSSCFSDVELEKFYSLLSRLKATGKIIIYITHDIKEALTLSDSITILQNGSVRCTLSPSSADEKTLLKYIAGEEFIHRYPKIHSKKERPILKVEDLRNEHVRGVSFRVYEGEILGITGLIGSGKSHVGMSLFGIESFTAKKASVFGCNANLDRPGKAISSKIGYISGETSETYIPDFTPEKNITLSNLKKVSPHYYINSNLEFNARDTFFKRLSIPGLFATQETRFLSGGLQQKLNIAKALYSDARILIMDQPTKGIDSASKSDVYNLMNDYVLHSNAIILISSDFEEIAGMCDRVLVMRKGKIVRELLSKDVTKDSIVYYSISDAT